MHKVHLYFDPERAAIVTEDGQVVANVVSIEHRTDLGGSRTMIEIRDMMVGVPPYPDAAQVANSACTSCK